MRKLRLLEHWETRPESNTFSLASSSCLPYPRSLSRRILSLLVTSLVLSAQRDRQLSSSERETVGQGRLIPCSAADWTLTLLPIGFTKRLMARAGGEARIPAYIEGPYGHGCSLDHYEQVMLVCGKSVRPWRQFDSKALIDERRQAVPGSPLGLQT